MSATEGQAEISRLIDRKHLFTYTAGEASLECEVLGLFIDQADVYLGQLKAAGDDQSWLEAAHGLKGMSRSIGAFSLADLAAWAEDESTGDAGKRREIFEQLAKTAKEVQAHARALIAELSVAE